MKRTAAVKYPGNIKTLYRANAASSQMDNLTYSYTTGTNKLVNIDDAQGASTGADLGDQGGNNYAYDATGNMTQDTAAGIEAGGIVWSPYNKIKSITKTGDSPTSKLTYLYDAQGNRVLKRYYVPDDTRLTTTWYVRDAQGNTLATYSRHKDSSQAWQSEAMVYGSARQAVVRTNAEYSDSYLDTISIFETIASRRLGEKSYELTDHLGNVRATVSDLLIDHSGSFDAELTTRTDYYPFGMIMGGRNYAAVGAHRYGFNGKENDNEVKGEGNQQDYGFRIYDPRVARFLSVDPLSAKYAMLSPYQYASLSPVFAIDVDGLEGISYREGLRSNDGTFTPIRRVIELDVYYATGENHPNAIQYPHGFSISDYVDNAFNARSVYDEDGLPVVYKISLYEESADKFSSQEAIDKYVSEKKNQSMVISTDASTLYDGSALSFPFAIMLKDQLPTDADGKQIDGRTTGAVMRLHAERTHYQLGEREVHEILHRLLQAVGKHARAPIGMTEAQEHALGGALKYGTVQTDGEGNVVGFQYDAEINDETHSRIVNGVPRTEDRDIQDSGKDD